MTGTMTDQIKKMHLGSSLYIYFCLIDISCLCFFLFLIFLQSITFFLLFSCFHIFHMIHMKRLNGKANRTFDHLIANNASNDVTDFLTRSILLPSHRCSVMQSSDAIIM